MSSCPNYFRVFLMFVRNSLVRDMMFPANFIIESISSFGWVMMNVGFYLLIFKYTSQINAGNTAGDAWDKYQFFVFIATSMFINSIVQMFFMTNADEFSELIRSGNLDFALLKRSLVLAPPSAQSTDNFDTHAVAFLTPSGYPATTSPAD